MTNQYVNTPWKSTLDSSNGGIFGLDMTPQQCNVFGTQVLWDKYAALISILTILKT